VHCQCGQNNRASYPDGIVAPVCYGPGMQSLGSYLSVRQYLPVERITELLSSLFGLSLSTGGVCYLLKKLKQKATPVYESIRQFVLKGRVVGADETGVNRYNVPDIFFIDNRYFMHRDWFCRLFGFVKMQ